MIDPLSPFVFPFPANVAPTNRVPDAFAVRSVQKQVADDNPMT